MLTSYFIKRLSRGDAGQSRTAWRATAALALGLAMSAPGTVSAMTFVDPVGDFLVPGYTGPQNSDLDIVSGSATYTPDHLALSLTVNGPIGSATATPYYLWGVNRGSGTDRLVTSGPPAVGDSSILLDTVVRFDFDGNGRVVTFASAVSPPVVTLLFTHSISGNTVSANIPWSALPSTGFAPADYTYVAWSRSALGSQEFIADLAPVPEPATWGLLTIGLAGVLAAAARRKSPAV